MERSIGTIPIAQPQRIPFWRDVRVLRVLAQVAFVLTVVIIVGLLYANLTQAMARRGMSTSFDFLKLEAGFAIKESVIPYDPSESYGKAFLVGVLNTLRVSLLGVILATLLGIIAGVARLSTNWLVNKIAAAYIEIFRNTPLLVQLFFWYFAVIQKFPPVRESIQLPGPIYLHQRGITIPALHPTPAFRLWAIGFAAGLVIGLVVYRILLVQQLETGRERHPGLVGFGLFVVLFGLGVLLSGGRPFTVETPVLQRFNFKGGSNLSPEFSALLIGLVVYTGAFIAEVVRAGILSVRKGQVEAARALGFSNMQALRLIIFPQALRVIIPPLTSQYLNLAKNSSLAVAVAYPDLYFIGGVIYNHQPGRPVPIIVLIMGTYLAMSLTTAILMNLYNRRIAFVER